MAQTSDEIAKDIIVAWLSRTEVHESFENATEAGEAIGKVYKAVYRRLLRAGIAVNNRPGDGPGRHVYHVPHVRGLGWMPLWCANLATTDSVG